MARRSWLHTGVLIALLGGLATGLVLWKHASVRAAEAASASQPEPAESVVAATAVEREHGRSTTAIGTVVALRSVTLRNELAGTVHGVKLTPGEVVEAGTVLVQLDISVESAELKAQEAQATLAQSMLERMQRLSHSQFASQADLDRTRAERDVALAQIARAKAVIARKTIRAPFRARVGIADVHPGQFLSEGTLLTTLQGVDEAAYVDFAVAQQVGRELRPGEEVEIVAANGDAPIRAKIVAIDARVDPATRNATARARIADAAGAPAPGASVRVRVPVGDPRLAVAVPLSAIRKGPAGDQVFVLATAADGRTRAQERAVRVEALLEREAVIESGLAAGEKVAASGSFKLRDGALVALSEGAPARAGQP
ncbi:efflux RND transporter periplasmic adaptor subunit [Dokdonella sp.]|uniref:efflux RND transporter periplasmic adaptor subunit n=1 Tax=Dokdonella sp. TaxID=2291710 RepID=UPI001B06C44D|nr:efflux RND transporter periplasmic adaptor subunit [Dokdonella sp.]MBO9664826.1 efflux RND transporter periplasmic adaptor subunit [Dokdonella sp.]